MNAITEILQTRKATLSASSLNRDTRTIEAIVATENLIPRARYGAPFAEKLRIDASAIDLSRFVGAPVLNGHRQNVEDMIGVIEAARIENRQLVAKIRIAAGEIGDSVIDKIADGILRSVSVGYVVREWSDATDEKGGTVRTATKWVPLEVSFVAIPADPAAQIRKANEMDLEQTAAPAENPPNAAVIENRAEANREIRSIANLAGLDAAWANGLIDRQASAEEARSAAFVELQKRSEATGPIRTQTLHNSATFDNPHFRAAAIGEALFARTTPSHKPSEPARTFVGYTTADIARDILKRAGVATTGMSPTTLITRALHNSGDFALILGDAANRTLRKAYDAAPAGVRQLARQTTVRDFRAKHSLQMSSAPNLEKVSEDGEFKRGTIEESGETYRAETFGKIFGISRQAMINDDLGAFSDLARRFGLAARAFENAKLVELLESNPAMSDGNALFHTAHGNLASIAGAPSETTLSAGRMMMRAQTDKAGELISVTPKFILTGSDHETGVQKLLSTITPAKVADANPFSNLSHVVDPRLQANVWYIVAGVEEVDGLEFSYLEGEPGPQIETRNGFDVDGVETKVRLDFGCGFVDWRGWFQNPGV